MTPAHHAREKIRIALTTGRWEFVQEAFAILDGATNNQPKPEPFRLPDAIRHMQRARAA